MVGRVSEQNYIPIDKDEWTKPTDALNLFKPSDNSIRYGIKDDMDQGSRYFRDTLTGVCYIYEIQFATPCQSLKLLPVL